MMPPNPGAYFKKKFHLAFAFIGVLSDRLAMSAGDGCGTYFSMVIKRSVGTKKRSPAKNGIQFSVTPLSSSHVPTDLDTPSETIKLAHNPATSASVFFLPSRNPSTSPKTTPSGKPFNSRQRIFQGRGTMPKSSNMNSAKKIRPSSTLIRCCRFISDTIFMPTHLAIT